MFNPRKCNTITEPNNDNGIASNEIMVVRKLPKNRNRIPEGISLDSQTGYMYIGLNGSIISGCDGDVSQGGQPI